MSGTGRIEGTEAPDKDAGPVCIGGGTLGGDQVEPDTVAFASAAEGIPGR
jgi:hypothetical protein